MVVTIIFPRKHAPFERLLTFCKQNVRLCFLFGKIHGGEATIARSAMVPSPPLLPPWIDEKDNH